MTEGIDRLQQDLDSIFLAQIGTVALAEHSAKEPQNAPKGTCLSPEQLATQRRALQRQCDSFRVHVNALLRGQPRVTSKDLRVAYYLESLRGFFSQLHNMLAFTHPEIPFGERGLADLHSQLQELMFYAPPEETVPRNRIARYFGR